VVQLIIERKAVFIMMLGLLLGACNFPGEGGASESAKATAGSTATAAVPTQPPAETSAPATESAPVTDERPEEATMILEPGPGSRLTSPFTIRGVADPTFEQTLIARLVDSSGTVLTEQPLMIQSPLGARGPFEGQIDFIVSEETNVFVQVYATSPRDGGITHLETVGGGITLIPEGSQQVVERDPYPERIMIYGPQNGQQISGGVVPVEGFGLASFEGTLVLALYSASGAELDLQAIIVKAPDMGTPGPFSGELSYSITEPMPARLVVRDPLPTGNGVNHIASVELRLLP
jgi:hypothetical protein